MDLPLIINYLKELQQQIIQQVASVESLVKFRHDLWHRKEGGGGLTCILQEGDIFESAGVNFSHITGASLPVSATMHRPELVGQRFEAMGLSLVFHPRNPFVPTTHANIRFFCAHQEGAPPIWWFGGGYDLTPYYGFEEDCIHWHQIAKEACIPFGETVYPHLKRKCDEYFYLKHRQEPRGIGGLFFDDLNEWGFDKSFAFLRAVGNSFLPAYWPILERRKDHPYGEKERHFQLYRRGRYVEFNLVYDRGTLFGLQSGGRTESILMSLPPQVAWQYDWMPKEGTAEERLYKDFLRAKDWL